MPKVAQLQNFSHFHSYLSEGGFGTTHFLPRFPPSPSHGRCPSNRILALIALFVCMKSWSDHTGHCTCTSEETPLVRPATYIYSCVMFNPGFRRRVLLGEGEHTQIYGLETSEGENGGTLFKTGRVINESDFQISCRSSYFVSSRYLG